MTAFGVQLPTFFPDGVVDAPAAVAAARTAEDLGFDSVWTGDHLSFHAPGLDAFPVLGAVAAATSRVSVGTGVLLPGLREPRWTAKAVRTLHGLSSGRFVLGVGVGGYRPEWDELGLSYERRGRITDAALDAMLPLPCPVWVGGHSRAALRRTARAGDGWFPNAVSPDGYRRRYAEIGKDVTRSFQLYVAFDRSEADAYFRGLYGVSLESMEHLVAFDHSRAARYLEAGVEHLVFHLACRDRIAGYERIMDTFVRALV